MSRFWDCHDFLPLFDDGQFIDAWLRWGRGSAQDQMRGGLVSGDTKELNVIPIIPVLRSGVSRTITKAWLVVKTPETALDPAENAAWTSASGMQSITTTEVAGRGVIINNSEGSPELRFDITAVNSTVLLPRKTYHLGIQVLMSDGALYEVERFTFVVLQQLNSDTL